MRAYKEATLIVFATFLLLFGILGPILPDRYVSEAENRTLQQKPKFSIDSLFSGEYTQALDSYWSDQFPLRDGFYSLYTGLSYALGQRDFSGFYVGKDKSLLQMQDGLDVENLKNNLAHVDSLAGRLGVPLSLLPVPGAASIYPEKLPYAGKDADLSKLYEAAQGWDFSLIDVRSKLEAHKEEYIYYYSDHHWTSLGAYLAYESFMEQTDRQAASLDAFSAQRIAQDFRGTGYKAVGLPGLRTDEIWAYDSGLDVSVELNLSGETQDQLLYLEQIEKGDPYAAFLNGNQALVQIAGGKKNGERLLILKDSYANCLPQFAVADFERVDLIDLRYFKQNVASYVQENKVTEVLVLYSMKNLCEDKNMYLLSREAE